MSYGECRAALDAFSRLARWPEALLQLRSMEKSSLRPSLKVINSMISAYGRGLQWLKASQSFRESGRRHVRGAAGLMSGFQRATRWRDASQLLLSLKKGREEANLVVYSSALGALRSWQIALALLKDLRDAWRDLFRAPFYPFLGLRSQDGAFATRFL